MNIQLIQGEFNSEDTLELLTQLTDIKIKYHENKISSDSNEEDIKSRESKIKNLQKELSELREKIYAKNKNYKINGTIYID